MKQRKIVSLFLALMLALSILTGCGSTAAPAVTGTPAAPEQTESPW